ncbi:MAG TPA: DUF4328 domain-containing protein [Actinophytocola sp.]|uniref:DUF4328 domain-containing protein n=1 Tax=Actinophytocola sp. TaxID=1872138 RepID=UPI002DDD0B60|nr:DUF4328 domain-containing protein [Actinophytocola sp.]HEV2781485.1 DUF4328 domain-containing protein [Actinophytocola sp.]
MHPHEPRPRWVATTPPRPVPPVRVRRMPYLGPPFYASPPRWGFPPLAWRWPTSVPGTRTRVPVSVDRVRALARQAAVALWMMAAVAVFAAAAEVWRYVLLVQSRTGALSRSVVTTSDALVVAGAVLAIGMGLLALGLTLWWLIQARGAATDLGGHEPARPDWQVLACLVIPGLNLVVPGSVLAELEHAVLRRPVTDRPRPGRLIVWWWVTWALSGLLFTATLLWRLRSGVQAQADGVLLNAATYLAAAAVAALTALVVRALTALLAPIDPASVRLMRVIKIDGAPDPPLRPGRPAGAVR